MKRLISGLVVASSLFLVACGDVKDKKIADLTVEEKDKALKSLTIAEKDLYDQYLIRRGLEEVGDTIGQGVSKVLNVIGQGDIAPKQDTTTPKRPSVKEYQFSINEAIKEQKEYNSKN